VTRATILPTANRTREWGYQNTYSIQYNKIEYSEVITVGNIVTAQYDTSMEDGLGWSRCVQTMRHKINGMHLHKINTATFTVPQLHYITTGHHTTK